MAVLIYPSLQAPVLTDSQQPEEVTESRWHQPWSEPVRVRIAPALAIALAASGLFFSPQQAGETGQLDKWYAWLSEPVRQKPGLDAARAQNAMWFAQVFFSESADYSKWGFAWSEPVRLDLRIGLRAHEQRAQTQGTDPIPLHPRSYGYVLT